MTRFWFAGGMGVLGGGLLFVPTVLSELAPLQFIAWTPLLLAVSFTRPRHIAIAATCMAISYVGMQSVVNGVSPMVALALLAHMAMIMVLFCALSRPFLADPSVAGAFAVGSLALCMDWVNVTVLPTWGMAQSWARPWSSSPVAIQFVSLTGLLFVSFITVSAQALLLCAIRRPRCRLRAAAVLLGLAILIVAVNAAIWNRQGDRKIRVAALGWTRSVFSRYESREQWFDDFFGANIEKASLRGARLIVSPELGLVFDGEHIDTWRKPILDLAKRNAVSLVVGYLDSPNNENRLMFVDSEGKLLGDYHKTYLTPVESTVPGDGEAVTVDLNGFLLGGVICHDDNFTSLTRQHGRAPVSLLAVPTNDWRSVLSAHFQSTRSRAIESSMAVVRAGGISAIITPRGEIVARRNHYTDGPGLIIGDVPVDPRATLFDRFGHWPVPLLGTFVMLMLLRTLLVKRREESARPSTTCAGSTSASLRARSSRSPE
jgi:apolipoprotein N-acyltransferase